MKRIKCFERRHVLCKELCNIFPIKFFHSSADDIYNVYKTALQHKAQKPYLQKKKERQNRAICFYLETDHRVIIIIKERSA